MKQIDLHLYHRIRIQDLLNFYAPWLGINSPDPLEKFAPYTIGTMQYSF